MADNKTFKLTIITPERVFYEGDVHFVEYTTTEGEVGVYAEHIPMTQIIDPGIIKIYEGDVVKEAALLSGFVEILKDSVKVLAESVEWPDEIDENRAEEAKIRAERRLDGQGGGSTQDMQRAEMALKRSMVRLNLKH